MASSPPPPFRKPTRKAGSLFGLFNFSAVANPFIEDALDGGKDDDTGKEWPVKIKPKADLNATTTDVEKEDAEITILDAVSGGDNGGNNSNSNYNTTNNSGDIGSKIGDVSDDWDDAEMEAQHAEIDNIGKIGGLTVDEEDMEAIASMLVEKPPTLRQLRGPKIDAASGGDGGDAGGSENGESGRSVDAGTTTNKDRDQPLTASAAGGADSLSDRRAQIKARAAVFELNEKEEDVKKEEAVPEKWVAETPGEKLMKQYESIDVSSSYADGDDNDNDDHQAARLEPQRETTQDIVSNADGNDDGTAAIEPLTRPLAPTHSIEEDYQNIKDKLGDNGNVNRLEQGVVDSAQSLATTKSIEEEDQKIENTMSSNNGRISSNGERVDSVVSLEKYDENNRPSKIGSVKEKEDSNVQPKGKVEGSNPLEAMLAAAAAATSFLPAPPPDPPTREQIDNNGDATNENLSEINRQLQATLSDQKHSLGQLRRKVNELERELLRTNRAKSKGVDEEVGARAAELREEYEGQLEQAKEAIAALEELEDLLSSQLEDGQIKLERAVEAKERVAAEYNYVVKSYTDLKGSVDSQTADWSTKLDESQRKIASLEAQLEETTRNLEKYQNESKSWRKECTSKADQLDTFTARVRDMEVTIDDLQFNIQNTTKSIDRIKLVAREEEDTRSKRNLQTLSDEYERLLDKKSKKIGELRGALRRAESEKRLAERRIEKEKAAALDELRTELTGEIDGLRNALKERDEEIGRMEGAAEDAERLREEREQLSAEIMFLTKSFEELQTELATNAEMYEDCIESFEKEAAEKDERIQNLEMELSAATEKISLLEAQIDELTVELERERSINTNLTATVSGLENELELARTNADGYDDIIAILREEAKTYETQLSESRDETKSYKEKMIELEELIEKTRDSLVDEKKRVYDALEEKDTQIAQLDRELAERMNTIHTSNTALQATKSKLEAMTKDFKNEKIRADTLDEKIQKLNKFAAGVNEAETSKEEIDRLTKLLKDVSASNEEYKSLVVTYQGKTKFLSQQLLLSGQSMLGKQSRITSLQEELSNAMTKAEAATDDRRSASADVSKLRTKLDEVQSKSTVWKAQANGMIVELTAKLKEKDESALELQSKLDKLSEEKEVSENDANEALEKEIAELKKAMEDAQKQAREKMRHKNQSLKEMEDAVASLTSAMEDLKRDKDEIVDRLEKEIKRHEEDLQSRDRMVHEVEDRLAKEHIAAITEMEEEMMETTRQLEMEIQLLKKKAKAAEEKKGYEAAAAATMKSTGMEQRRVREMEEALRKSKDKEVSLINQNMKMQHYLQELQLERERQSAAESGAVNDGDDEEESAVELPTYYKEKQRPVVIRFLGNAWKKLFRRKRKLL